MKSRVWIMTIFLVIMMTNMCYAEINVVHKGDADIYFARGRMDKWNYEKYLEIQHVFRDGKDYSLLHILAKVPGIVQAEIKTDDNGSFILQETEVKHDGYIPQGYIDKWYIMNRDDWEKIATSKKIKCELSMPDGKSKKGGVLRVTAQEILAVYDLKAEQFKNIEAKPYGPDYSVFFPNKTYKEVKDAFIYHLNDRTHKHEPISFYGFWRYAINDKLRTLGFEYDNSSTKNYVNFVETSKGTWLNLYSWSMWGSSKSGYEYVEWNDKENITMVLKKIYNTYRALEPHVSYGFTIKGGSFKKPLIVENVDVQFNPGLSVINKGNKIIKVNDMDVSDFYNFQLEYLLMYGQASSDLRLTVEDKNKNIVEATAKTVTFEPPSEVIDYAAVNAKQDYLWFEKRDPTWYTSNFFCAYEILDPYGNSEENISSKNLELMQMH